jgi:hypothetical protein
MEVITPRSGVGIQIEKRLVLAPLRPDQQAKNQVFENIGEIAGVETVAVTEHSVVIWENGRGEFIRR